MSDNVAVKKVTPERLAEEVVKIYNLFLIGKADPMAVFAVVLCSGYMSHEQWAEALAASMRLALPSIPESSLAAAKAKALADTTLLDEGVAKLRAEVFPELNPSVN